MSADDALAAGQPASIQIGGPDRTLLRRSRARNIDFRAPTTNDRRDEAAGGLTMVIEVR
jgi:hypothetical protein